MNTQNKLSQPHWVRALSTKRNIYYYFNTITKESFWNKPEGVEIVEDLTMNQQTFIANNHEEDTHFLAQLNAEEKDPKIKKILEKLGQFNTTNKVNATSNKIHSKRPKISNNYTNEICGHSKEIGRDCEGCCKSIQDKLDYNKSGSSKHSDGSGGSDGQQITKKYINPNIQNHEPGIMVRKRKLKLEPLPQNNLTKIVHNKCFKTPIQDAFNKKKAELLKRQFKKLPEIENEACLKPKEQQHHNDIIPKKENKIIGLQKIENEACLNPNQQQHLNGIIQKKKNNITGLSKLENGACLIPNQQQHNTNTIPYEENKIFDLRTKIKKQKKELSHVECPSTINADNEMEWEDIGQNEPLTQRITNNEATKNEQLPRKHKMSFSTKTLQGIEKIFLVCDTNALMDDLEYIQKLLRHGVVNDISVKVVIPFIILDELDHLKDKKTNVAFTSREISRMFLRSHKSKNLIIQDGSEAHRPVGSLSLNCNDNLVLNCVLQFREECKENELAILLTNDNNLTNKAISFKVTTYNWPKFKRWIKFSFIEKSLMSKKSTDFNSEPYYEQMDIDAASDKEEENTDHTGSEVHIQNCSRSFLHELKVEFQAFLHSVLKDALGPQFGLLNLASWSLINLLAETQIKWDLINSLRSKKDMQNIFKSLIAAIKKLNHGKEDFNKSDMENVFTLCEHLAIIISEKHATHCEMFLNKLKGLKDEWLISYNSVSSSSITSDDDEISVQSVDVALQNIYNCLEADLKNWTDVSANGNLQNEDELLLSKFYNDIKKLVTALKNIFQDNPDKLSRNNKKIHHLQHLISNFNNGIGETFGFDFTLDNVVELFQDNTYRKSVKTILDNLIKMEISADKLLSSLED